ncbi:uncharacterized protein G2W53_035730 [Senna tora]|uniref:Uncharacterized protein n=1 Tax=Senna tora TaxID=362788 RepID=A0A834W4C6_9FABA|nr:uncharacterized protein G2W53_035730 [Senna tora]
MNGVGEVAEEGLNQSLPSSTSDSENNNYCYFVGVMEIIEKQEIGKFILGLVIPMVMALVFSVSHVATSPEMVGACIALCIAFAAIWNAILLAKIFPTPSIIILILVDPCPMSPRYPLSPSHVPQGVLNYLPESPCPYPTA